MDIDGMRTEENGQGLRRYLSPLSVWALSFGCAVGWGSFVMPGTTFLPKAGPLGTVLGIAIGAVIMFIIGVNYHYLMNKYPDAGGTLTYSIKSFGYDHGFLSAWFLILAYVAIMWANASALALIARNILGDVFQFGFHYQILGYDIWLGEILLTLAVIVIFGLVCILGKRLSVILQVVLALTLLIGVILVFAVCASKGGTADFVAKPFFSPNGKSEFTQIFTIIALSPWAFIGFESVSNSASGFRFHVKKTLVIFGVSIVCGAVVYILLNQLAVLELPEGYRDWTGYIADVGGLSGVSGIPTFHTAGQVMGRIGILVLGLAALAGIITGLVGNYIAASRLLYAMSEERILPKWFGKLNANGTPRNALIFLMLISLIIPFLGRTAIGWIVDVNTIGATIAYGYTSAAALKHARLEKNKKVCVTGVIGLLMSFLFFFYFMASANGAMSTESYLILAFWSILGFVYFRYVFGKDKEQRFGKSTVVWIGLLFVIFFTSLMWVKQATDDMTTKVVENISEYYEERVPNSNPQAVMDTEVYLARQMEEANRLQTRNIMIQMGLILISLAIMFSIYSMMQKQEKKMELEKTKAEESNKAKSVFFSNMSHDIRTPMNAIIGYLNLAEQEGNSISEIREYLGKIRTSSNHLLALINDVLEMSRIESGKMDLEPIPIDLKKTLEEVKDMFANQMAEKYIRFLLDTEGVTHTRVMCDKNRLNRVLLNLVSNAYKFTPEGGTVSIRLSERADAEPEKGYYELRVSDSGIGMSEEFAARVFEAFEREKSESVEETQGTGLGMAITRSIIELMGGTIGVHSEQGKGTQFVIGLSLPFAAELKTAPEEDGNEEKEKAEVDYTIMRLLLCEDMAVNREIAKRQLEAFGFTVETAVNGKEAVEKMRESEAGYFDAVLMDIQMPILDGYQATEQIRSIEDDRGKVPIIAMTANAFSEDVKKALDAGMNAHVAKPVDLKILKQVLKELLG